jgi:phage tail-like protein
MSPTAGRVDPYMAGNFVVAIGNAEPTPVSEVLGLEAAIDVVEYRNGNLVDNTPTKLAGLNRFSNVTLKRGFTQDTSLWTWFNNATNGNLVRNTVSITLRDQADNPVWVWQLKNAWPCKWTGPTLVANSSEVAIEALEICHEGIELALPGTGG